MRFFLPVSPVAKGRPRFDTRGKKPRAYTPAKTRKNESALALLASAYRPDMLFCGSLAVIFDFVFEVPTRKRRGVVKPEVQYYGKKHVRKPDADNLAKTVLDALEKTGQWFLNDSQVAELHVLKRYQSKGEPYGIWIDIEAHDS